MKAKPIILVIAILVIGFVLGMLTSAQIRYHKLKPVKVYFSEERFRDGFYRAIEPDEQQKAKIDLLLDKYARINSERQDNFRKELDASMKEFRKEIDTFLTKEQLIRLKDMDDRRHEMIKQYRRNHENDSLKSGRDWGHDREERPGSDRLINHPHTEPVSPELPVSK